MIYFNFIHFFSNLTLKKYLLIVTMILWYYNSIKTCIAGSAEYLVIVTVPRGYGTPGPTSDRDGRRRRARPEATYTVTLNARQRSRSRRRAHRYSSYRDANAPRVYPSRYIMACIIWYLQWHDAQLYGQYPRAVPVQVVSYIESVMNLSLVL